VPELPELPESVLPAKRYEKIHENSYRRETLQLKPKAASYANTFLHFRAL